MVSRNKSVQKIILAPKLWEPPRKVLDLAIPVRQEGKDYVWLTFWEILMSLNNGWGTLLIHTKECSQVNYTKCSVISLKLLLKDWYIHVYYSVDVTFMSESCVRWWFRNIGKPVFTQLLFLYTELKVDVEEEVAKYRVYAERVRPLVANTLAYVHKCLQENKKVLVEGANAAMLDIDFGEFSRFAHHQLYSRFWWVI